MTRWLSALVVLAVVCTAIALAQPTFRAGVDVVRVDVSVMNGLSPVAGLTIDQFAVTDNGVPQTLESVSLDTVPLSLTLLLDTSGSMEGERLNDLIDAANTLIKGLRNGDAISLISFSDAVRVRVPMTRDRAPLLASLKELAAVGFTALNDAAFLAMQLRPLDAGDSRPVLLVFSDGHDTASWINAAQMLDATRRSGMLTHVVELMGAVEGIFRPSDVLGELASAGGGRRWSAQTSRDLRDLFGKVLNELRSRYLLTYVPKGVTREGWHDVKVTLKGARGDVTARPGYFAAPQ